MGCTLVPGSLGYHKTEIHQQDPKIPLQRLYGCQEATTNCSPGVLGTIWEPDDQYEKRKLWVQISELFQNIQSELAFQVSEWDSKKKSKLIMWKSFIFTLSSCHLHLAQTLETRLERLIDLLSSSRECTGKCHACDTAFNTWKDLNMEVS